MYPPLYKYCKFSNENYDYENVKNDILYFTSPCSYNDPYEGIIATDIYDILEAFITVKLKKYSSNFRNDLNLWKKVLSFPKLILNPQKNKLHIKSFLDKFIKSESANMYDKTVQIAMNFLYYDPYLEMFPYISYAFVTVEMYQKIIEDAINHTTNLNNEEKEYHICRLVCGYKEKYNIVNNLRKKTNILVPITIVDSIFNTPFKKQTYEETLIAVNNIIKETFESAKTFPDKWFLTTCLSENPYSILMWSHYAANHTGFCLEYDFNKADQRFISEHLAKVEYSHKLIRFKKSSLIQFIQIKTNPNYLKNKTITKTTNNTVLSAILTKNSVWKYEQEWRLVFKKSDENLIPKFPYVTKILLGYKISDTDKQLLIGLAKQKSIPVFQAYLLPDQYTIGYYPVVL